MTDLVTKLRRWTNLRGSAETADMVNEAADEITRLRAELESARADAQRLDWLQNYDDGFHNIDRISSVAGRGFNGLPSLRAAIDAAMGAKP